MNLLSARTSAKNQYQKIFEIPYHFPELLHLVLNTMIDISMSNIRWFCIMIMYNDKVYQNLFGTDW